MKTATILRAIDALEKANDALVMGDLYISAQIKLGGECFGAAFQLRAELERELPDVKVEL